MVTALQADCRAGSGSSETGRHCHVQWPLGCSKVSSVLYWWDALGRLLALRAHPHYQESIVPDEVMDGMIDAAYTLGRRALPSCLPHGVRPASFPHGDLDHRMCWSLMTRDRDRESWMAREEGPHPWALPFCLPRRSRARGSPIFSCDHCLSPSQSQAVDYSSRRALSPSSRLTP